MVLFSANRVAPSFNTGISVLSTDNNSIETNGGIIANGITASNYYLNGTGLNKKSLLSTSGDIIQFVY